MGILKQVFPHIIIEQFLTGHLSAVICPFQYQLIAIASLHPPGNSSLEVHGADFSLLQFLQVQINQSALRGIDIGVRTVPVGRQLFRRHINSLFVAQHKVLQCQSLSEGIYFLPVRPVQIRPVENRRRSILPGRSHSRFSIFLEADFRLHGAVMVAVLAQQIQPVPMHEQKRGIAGKLVV